MDETLNAEMIAELKTENAKLKTECEALRVVLKNIGVVAGFAGNHHGSPFLCAHACVFAHDFNGVASVSTTLVCRKCGYVLLRADTNAAPPPRT